MKKQTNKRKRNEKKKGRGEPYTFLSLLFNTRKGNIEPKVVGLLALMIRLELFVTEQIAF